MLNLLALTLIIVFIVDLSGFVPEISKIIWHWMYPTVKYVDWIIPKPFSCSLCMTFWTGLLYLLLANEFTFLMVLFVALLAFLTPVINTALLWIKDGLIWLLNKMYKLINS